MAYSPESGVLSPAQKKTSEQLLCTAKGNMSDLAVRK